MARPRQTRLIGFAPNGNIIDIVSSHCKKQLAGRAGTGLLEPPPDFIETMKPCPLNVNCEHLNVTVIGKYLNTLPKDIISDIPRRSRNTPQHLFLKNNPTFFRIKHLIELVVKLYIDKATYFTTFYMMDKGEEEYNKEFCAPNSWNQKNVFVIVYNKVKDDHNFYLIIFQNCMRSIIMNASGSRSDSRIIFITAASNTTFAKLMTPLNIIALRILAKICDIEITNTMLTTFWNDHLETFVLSLRDTELMEYIHYGDMSFWFITKVLNKIQRLSNIKSISNCAPLELQTIISDLQYEMWQYWGDIFLD